MTPGPGSPSRCDAARNATRISGTRIPLRGLGVDGRCMDPTPDHGSHLPDGAHRQAGLDEELAADGLDLTPVRDEIDVPGVTAPEEVLERSELAIYLRPSVFPASAASLVGTASDEHAPPEILER